MPLFVYQALQSGGGKISGELEALSRQDAFAKLRQQNLQPFSLAAKGAEAAAAAAAGASASSDNSLNRAQVLLFTEELCELLEAGLKLDRALQVIEQRQDKSSLSGVAASARQSLREGATFSAAFALRVVDLLLLRLLGAVVLASASLLQPPLRVLVGRDDVQVLLGAPVGIPSARVVARHHQASCRPVALIYC